MKGPFFERYVGIDYSGAATPTTSLPGLRVYLAERSSPPVEVAPPPGPRKYWTRRGVAEWLAELLGAAVPTIVGIDHAFSFPRAYFEQHGLTAGWLGFLEDFQRHWPTDGEYVYVDFVRDGSTGNGLARMGDRRWRRLTERAAGSAKSVFHFDVTGSVAKSTHAGLPWLLDLRRTLGPGVHFWPFDGWTIPPGSSVIAETYPALWNKHYPREGRTHDQHDAWSVAQWLRDADAQGELEAHFSPILAEPERAVAEMEGWILGVASAEPPRPTRRRERSEAADRRRHGGAERQAEQTAASAAARRTPAHDPAAAERALAMTGAPRAFAATQATMRPYSPDDDVWRVREFLVELWAVAPPGRTWDVRRWDGCCFYGAEPGLDRDRASRTRLWCTPAGRIVAALLSEGDAEIHPHVHPVARDLEDEVLTAGERVAAEHGNARVVVLCYEHDVERSRLLQARGYEPTEHWGVLRRLRLGNVEIPGRAVAPGYRMRTTRPDEADHQRIADLLNAAFGRTFHHAGETRGFQRHAPSFRRELDLVAEAPDGSLAAYAAVCWDAANRHGIFEPVCTHPDHRQLGLARALMLEGIRRARDLGAVLVDVETGEMGPANALYDSIGFGERYRAACWRKAIG